MLGEDPTFFVEDDEYIRADFLDQKTMKIQELTIPGPQLVRISARAHQPEVGHTIRLQIGFNRGQEVIVAPDFEGTVYKREQ